MSIKLMTAVWELNLPPGEKLVLLALADQANDAGVQCWPSVATIAHRSGQGERTVRRALSVLETKGHMTREHRDGDSNEYHIHPCQNGTPAKMAPLPKTPDTPAKMAGKPSKRTVKEDESVERAREILTSPEWKAFRSMRRDIHRPLNPTSEKRILAKLKNLADAGYPPGEVLEQSTANCWRGVFKITEESDDDGKLGRGQHKQPNIPPANGLRGSRPDPALDMGRQARAELAAESAGGYQEPDRGPWPSLPSFGPS